MNPASKQVTHTVARLCATTLLAVVHLTAWAGPGAHGPGGEHLDDPAPSKGGATSPRLEAKSELFELVATLRGGELSLLIDRYASNEPVLNAQVEVESGALKAKAVYQANQGDYAVADPAFIKAMSSPGEHALVVTIVAGPDTDLLDGTLVTGAARASVAAHGHAPADARWSKRRIAAVAAAVLVLTLGSAALAAWLRSRRRSGAASMEAAL